MGPTNLYQIGIHKIQNGNCLFHLENMTDEFISVCVTSPPYNIGTSYNSFRDNMKEVEYLSWVNQWVHQIHRVLEKQGSFFLNIGSKPTQPLLPFKMVSLVSEIFQLQNTFHWIKSISVGEQSSGHYKPVNSPRFVNNCHEYIFHFTKKGDVELDRKAIGVPYVDDSNAKRWGNKKGLRCRGNNWFIPYKTIQSRDKERPHPATFPVQLVENCLKIHGVDKITRVLDPFLGIGSTIIGCENVGVPCIGMEVDEFYVQETLKRVSIDHGRK